MQPRCWHPDVTGGKRVRQREVGGKLPLCPSDARAIDNMAMPSPFDMTEGNLGGQPLAPITVEGYKHGKGRAQRRRGSASLEVVVGSVRARGVIPRCR